MMATGAGWLILLLLLLGGAVLLALVAGVIFLLVRGTGSTGTSGVRRQQTARQILDERLARGEITREEYEEIRARIDE